VGAAPSTDLERELDRLSALSPDDFTAARNALADTLREEGRGAEAAEVKSLRRPSRALWATNQLAREHPDDLAELIAASDRLRRAQAEASPADVRAAARARREVVARLTRAAGEILARAGAAATGSHVERVTATLMAAGEDEEAAGALARGRLVHELTPSGFGALGPLAATLVEAAEDDDYERRAAAREAEELAREARAAEVEASRLEAAAAAAEAAARRAQRAADRARARAEELRARADAATP
jgi:hypothetical protein